MTSPDYLSTWYLLGAKLGDIVVEQKSSSSITLRFHSSNYHGLVWAYGIFTKLKPSDRKITAYVYRRNTNSKTIYEVELQVREPITHDLRLLLLPKETS